MVHLAQEAQKNVHPAANCSVLAAAKPILYFAVLSFSESDACYIKQHISNYIKPIQLLLIKIFFVMIFSVAVGVYYFTIVKILLT